MFYYLGYEDGSHIVLDTTDNVSEGFPSGILAKLNNRGIHITALVRNHIIISQNKNKYSLKILGTSDWQYSGSFPKVFDNKKLYEHRIHLVEVSRMGNYLLCLVTCTCFCEYDFEVPFIMVNLVAIDIRDINNSFLSLYTSKPLYQYFNNAPIEMMVNKPNDCCIESDRGITLDTKFIKIFDLVFDYVPNNLDIFNRVTL